MSSRVHTLEVVPRVLLGSPLAVLLVVRAHLAGVVRSYVGKGGAVFLGLAKARLPRIRPTLLEQSQIAAMRFDFLQRRLELAPSALIPRSVDALRMLDLRLAGAPVSNYAVRVARLVVNGEVVRLSRPLVAVIDTGTTGASISDDLFD